jgi:hypothetical protein
MAYSYDRRTATKKPVETFTNEEDQMQVNIFENEKGTYNVMLKDLDSGNTVPGGFVYVPTLHEAITRAKKMLHGHGGPISVRH